MLTPRPRVPSFTLDCCFAPRAPSPRATSAVHIVGHNAGEEVDRTLFDNWTGAGGPNLQALAADELAVFDSGGSAAMGGLG